MELLVNPMYSMPGKPSPGRADGQAGVAAVRRSQVSIAAHAAPGLRLTACGNVLPSGR